MGKGIFWVGGHFYRKVGVSRGIFWLSGGGWTFFMGGWG